MKQKKLFYLSISLLTTGSMHAVLTPLQSNIQRAQRRAGVNIIRNAALRQAANQPLGEQPTNGDEERYDDKRGSFGKALAQNNDGLMNTSAFAQMVRAIETENIGLFNQITMGTDPVDRRLVDPQAAFAFNLDGADGWIHTMSAAPALASAQAAGEMVELYGHVYLRDVAFNDYDTSPRATSVITALNALSDFKGPKVGGVVTAGTLFRGSTPGDLVGPYVSQFLYQPIPFGPGPNYNGSGALPPAYQEQVVPTSTTDNDFMTTFATWSDVQKGITPPNMAPTAITYTDTRIFIRNARDLGDYVHQDCPQETYINAALILLGYGKDALDRNNPYLTNPTQEAFVTYYMPDVIYLLAAVTEFAFRAAWYQKWVVHRRVRPEFFGFLTNQQRTGVQDFGLNSELITSTILDLVAGEHGGSFYLPQAYPEGSPTHPAYPAGHATVAGACVTILKAFFNEDFVIPSPVEPNAANDALVDYVGTPLTVGGELNKLAANISLGRDMAGVHYRSDGLQGMLLGEKVAIALLQNEAFTRHIPFAGFSLTTFSGKKINVGAQQTVPLY